MLEGLIEGVIVPGSLEPEAVTHLSLQLVIADNHRPLAELQCLTADSVSHGKVNSVCSKS